MLITFPRLRTFGLHFLYGFALTSCALSLLLSPGCGDKDASADTGPDAAPYWDCFTSSTTCPDGETAEILVCTEITDGEGGDAYAVGGVERFDCADTTVSSTGWGTCVDKARVAACNALSES